MNKSSKQVTEQLGQAYSVTINTETGQFDITGWNETWGMERSTAENLRDFLNKTLPTPGTAQVSSHQGGQQ